MQPFTAMSGYRRSGNKKGKTIVMQRPFTIDVRDPATGLPLRTADPLEDSGTGEADLDVDPLQPGGSDDHDDRDDDDDAHGLFLMDDAAQDFAADMVLLPYVDIPLHGGINAWLEQQLQAHDSEGSPVQVLELSSDGIVTLMMPAYDAQKQVMGIQALLSERQLEARINPFVLVEIRPIAFADGAFVCCTCSNPGCNRTDAAAHLMRGEMQQPEQPHRTCADALQGESALCRCAEAALTACFGAIGGMDAGEEYSFCSWYQEQDVFSMVSPISSCKVESQTICPQACAASASQAFQHPKFCIHEQWHEILFCQSI